MKATNTKTDEQKAIDFDGFLKLNGYNGSGPSNDCSNLQNEKDCLSRGEQEPGCCENCRKFAEIQNHWENICERNALRVARGGDMAIYYGRLPGVEEYAAEEAETTLIDLLTDLRHWAAKNEVDFGQAIESSGMHFEAEIGGEP